MGIHRQTISQLVNGGYVSWWVSGDCVAQTQHIFTAVSANRPFCFLMASNRSFLTQAEAWRVPHLHNSSTDYLYVPTLGKLVNTSFLKSQ